MNDFKGDTPRENDRVEVKVQGRVRDVGEYLIVQTNHGNAEIHMSDASVEVLERADDPEIGLVRRVEPSHDGKPKTAVKVGALLSPFPGERSVWVIVETGEVLPDGQVTGLGEVVSAVAGTPAAEAEKPDPGDVPGPRCNAIEGATGINCRLPRLHGKDVEHEGWHEPVGERDSVGYRLFVRWPWNEWDRDYAAVVGEEPLPDWEREILEQEAARKQPVEPRVFRSDGPEPPEDVKALHDGSDSIPYLVRYGDHWRWTKSLEAPEHPAYTGGSWEYVVGEMDRPVAFTEVLPS